MPQKADQDPDLCYCPACGRDVSNDALAWLNTWLETPAVAKIIGITQRYVAYKAKQDRRCLRYRSLTLIPPKVVREWLHANKMWKARRK